MNVEADALRMFDELMSMDDDKYDFFVKLETLILMVKLENNIELAVRADSEAGSLQAARQFYSGGRFAECVLELRRVRSAFLSKNKDFAKLRHKYGGPPTA